VLIPSENQDQEWQTITDVDTMERQLLQQGKQHFQKAEGTPYTQEPLRTLLRNDGIMEFGDQIHHGEPIDSALQINPPTRILLEHQQNGIPNLLDRTHPMPFEAVIQCFKKWPEKTATSPSRRHLGIYKTLQKDQHHKQPSEPITTKGINLMQDIHWLLVLALQDTHTFTWWQTIWNLYLKKEPGKPYIHCLWMLHLIEADLNLILKWHSSKGFMQQAETNNSLDDVQYGGRVGWSAIDLACQWIATFETYCIQRMTAIKKV